MQKGFLKGLKPLFIKRLAMLIGICYLLNPLQKQISFVFHEISHAFEMPDYIMSHNSNSSYEHKVSEHLDSRIGDVNHDHEIVDFIDSAFAASNNHDGSEDSLLNEVKIDKHITSYQFQLQKHIDINISLKIWSPSEDSELVYLRQLEEPPQYLNNKGA